MRRMSWPPWAYGAAGAGYALAAGFSTIYIAPWFMSPSDMADLEPGTWQDSAAKVSLPVHSDECVRVCATPHPAHLRPVGLKPRNSKVPD
jgi:hypothetical protein